MTPNIAVSIRTKAVAKLSELREVEFAGLVAGHARLREDPLGHRSYILACSDLAAIGSLCAAGRSDAVLARVLHDSGGCCTPSPLVTNANRGSSANLDLVESSSARINLHAADDDLCGRV